MEQLSDEEMRRILLEESSLGNTIGEVRDDPSDMLDNDGEIDAIEKAEI